jgi:ATP-binding cassette subfamily B protein
VVVHAAGHLILGDVDLEIAPGSHVAIVGPSGAGKSTLAGMLLGWHRPSSGDLRVDGESLVGARLDALRNETAWVDPSVRIWNRSLLDNLLYGCSCSTPPPLGPVLEAAGLIPIVAKLPNGLATPLGEGGTLLSAGEAQRVRLGRAMLRPGVRLAILDEPFLGLERDRRRTLLSQVRQRWATSTLLYVTHDVAEARSFDRVLVLERGRIVEDGDPRILTQTASSRFRRLLQAQDAVQGRFAAQGEWRKVRIHDGRIIQEQHAAIEQTA